MASSSTTAGLCPDWILSNNSNVHVARDCGWYTTYTPFPTFATTMIADQKLDASGVGDVEIPVELYPGHTGPCGGHGTLRLRNVLHVPGAVCNILGGPQTGDYDGLRLFYGNSNERGEITDGENRRLASLHSVGGGRVGFAALKLSGPPVGPVVGESPFGPGNSHYMIHAIWPDSERARWAAAAGHEAAPASGSSRGAEGAPQGGAASSSAPPYTQEERDWLKRIWGDEYTFLLLIGLSIHKDEDREEGRRKLRAMMSDYEDDRENEDEDEDDGEPSERVIQSHFADYNFTAEEVEFINKGWGSSEMFMVTSGLKCYKDEDCEEAKAIVRTLMAPDDDDDDDSDLRG